MVLTESVVLHEEVFPAVLHEDISTTRRREDSSSDRVPADNPHGKLDLDSAEQVHAHQLQGQCETPIFLLLRNSTLDLQDFVTDQV